jgi:predicted aminopeptidase
MPVVGILAALSLSACSTIGYYGHLAHGEYSMLAAREPIARIIADPQLTRRSRPGSNWRNRRAHSPRTSSDCRAMPATRTTPI